MLAPGFDLAAAITLALAFAIGVVIGAIGFVLGRIISPRRELPMKRERYECGNKPMGRARGWFAMQYYPYLIVFLTVEPIAIYCFLSLILAKEALLQVSAILALIVAMLAPTLLFGLEAARRVELWLVQEDSS
ncbi:MAG: hypothetical protein DRN96_00225 [Thermoproteota archaeon]|nr:MAG: hypothetical protein DRN96_00225 [Candidatus Korarchaeota archaeon]RLG54199.1 MAG: hypothetical protein DRN99_05500 [Candidatus Korarchaeota archaeon]